MKHLILAAAVLATLPRVAQAGEFRVIVQGNVSSVCTGDSLHPCVWEFDTSLSAGYHRGSIQVLPSAGVAMSDLAVSFDMKLLDGSALNGDSPMLALWASNAYVHVHWPGVSPSAGIWFTSASLGAPGLIETFTYESDAWVSHATATWAESAAVLNAHGSLVGNIEFYAYTADASQHLLLDNFVLRSSAFGEYDVEPECETVPDPGSTFLLLGVALLGLRTFGRAKR